MAVEVVLFCLGKESLTPRREKTESQSKGEVEEGHHKPQVITSISLCKMLAMPKALLP